MSFSNFFYQENFYDNSRVDDNIEFAERILLEVGLIILKLENYEYWKDLNKTANDLFKNKTQLKLLSDDEMNSYYNLIQRIDNLVKNRVDMNNTNAIFLNLTDCNEIIQSDSIKKVFMTVILNELEISLLTRPEQEKLKQLKEILSKNCDLKKIRNLLPEFDMILHHYEHLKEMFEDTLKDYFLPIYFAVDNALIEQEKMRKALFM